MKLAVGDVVVCPALGAGRVAAMEKRVVLGVEQDVVVLELTDGLLVTLVRAENSVRAFRPSSIPALL